MSEIKDDLKYTKDHEWVKLDGDTVTIGITDFAQDSLGDLVYVELPDAGANFNQGDDMVIVESCKAASDVYAPINGEVVAVNDNAVDSPDLVNTSSYDDGWLVKLKVTDNTQLEALMSAAQYKEHIAD